MGNEEFSKLRHYLGKTQRQMSLLLGCSLKALQSFEQGRRRIPMHIERQVLFFLHMTKSSSERYRPCWVIEECPMDTREHCPVWEFKVGHICWFINGTICHGRTQINWQEKMERCRQCKVYHAIMPDYQTSQTVVSSFDANLQRSKKALKDPVGKKTGNKLKTAIFRQFLAPEKRCPSFVFDHLKAFKTVDTEQDGKITRTAFEATANRRRSLKTSKNTS